jgi:RNA polymerase sigma-70 factor (ECF subfamily)
MKAEHRAEFKYQVPVKTMLSTDGRQQTQELRRLDSKAIGAVYDQYFSEVYRYVLYRVGDQALAEDIASDVFIRLLEAVQSGHGPQTSLKGWLIGTASHIVTDHMRRKYRRQEEEVPESLPDLQPGPASETDRREQNRQLKEAMSKLTDEQQHVLTLRFNQGYSLEETATFMNKNVNAVKALQFRALAALQREIGEVDYE